MTISSTTNRVSYSGNGATTAFAFSYPFQAQSDLKVLLVLLSTGVETLQTITTHYTISGTTTNGVYASGGTVNMLTAPSSLYKVVIYREPALTQTIDLVENGSLPAETLEQGLDKAILIAQRIDERVERSITLPEGFTATFDMNLPSDINTANALLVVNATGDGWDVGPTTTDLENAEDNAAEAEASALAAAASAASAATSASNAATYAAASAWNDVAYKTSADSPINISDSDAGTLFAIDCTSGNVVVNLPSIAVLSLTGPWTIGFKKTDSSSNTITINRDGTDTIDGASSKVLSRQYSGTNLIPDLDGSPDNWTAMTFGEFPISGAMVGDTDTQTLTNKTFGDALTFAEIATPSTPASGFGKTYFKSDGKLYVLDDTGAETQVGSGAGGINYLSTNPDAESAVTGHSAYADAAATSPVDMIGGSPNVTITRTTSSPRRGNASFLITKDAVNRQGEGVSVDFTIAGADTYQMLEIFCEYLASASYVDDDVRLYIYDVTNATIIEPIGRDLKANTLGGKHYAYFQATNSTSYRFGFHISSTNAAAYTIQYDTISIGPNQLAKGAIVTDWVSSTPTVGFTGGTLSTSSMYSRRVGDTGEIKVALKWSSIFTGGSATINLPSGWVLNSSKFPGTIASPDYILGRATLYDISATNPYFASVVYNSTTSVILRPEITVGGNTFGAVGTSAISTTYPFTWANNDEVFVEFTVPVVGWSSSINIASEASNKVIAFKASLTGNASIGSASLTLVPFNTVSSAVNNGYDTAGAFDTTNSRFVAPESGNYYFAAHLLANSNVTASAYYTVSFRKNGTSRRAFRWYFNDTVGQWYGSATFSLIKGDYIDIATIGDAAYDILGSDGSSAAIFEGFKIQGNQTIGYDEVVGARYSTDAGLAVANGAQVTVVFEDKIFDTHNAYNTSTGEYTIPVAGMYGYNYLTTWGGTTGWAIGEASQTSLQKNAVDYHVNDVFPPTASSTTRVINAGSDLINCAKGDVIRLQITQNSGSSQNLVSTSTKNYFSIVRVK